MHLDLQLLQHLLEVTPDAVILVDADGTIVHANAAVQGVFGHAPSSLIGQPIEVLVPQAKRGAHAHSRQGFSERQGHRPMGSGLVVPGLHADGSTVPLDVKLAPLRHEDRTVTVAVARNIAHIVRLQDALAQYAEQLEASLAQSEQARARLVELDAEKNRILGVAAHDLRNPLSALRVFTDLLEDGSLGPVSEAYQPLVSRMSRSVDYMANLVDQLLDWAAIESGKLQLDRRPTDLAQLVDSALAVERLAATTGEVAIEADLDPTLGLLHLDAHKAEQVVHNLVSNAVRHTPPGGRVSVDLAAQDGHAVLRVRDQGPGVPDEDKARIFEPFSRGRDSRDKGVGLGLAIVARIVSGHGGSASVEDTPGGGATFVARFPLGPGTAD